VRPRKDAQRLVVAGRRDERVILFMMYYFVLVEEERKYTILFGQKHYKGWKMEFVTMQ
jgi:hypothetical protein